MGGILGRRAYRIKEHIAHRFDVVDTEAFNFILGTVFLVEIYEILSLKVQAPYVLQVDHGDGGTSVLREQSEHTSSYQGLCKKEPSAVMVASKTEDSQLLAGVVDQGVKESAYSREDLNVEFLASDKQHVWDLYCSKGQNSRYEFYWPTFRMAYGNLRVSELERGLTKLPFEHSRMALCSPDWRAHGGMSTGVLVWRSLTLTSIQTLDNAIYMPLGRKTSIGNAGWGSMLSVVDGGLAPVHSEDLDPAMVQQIQRESSSYTLDVLKKQLRP